MFLEVFVLSFVSVVLFGLLFAAGFFGARYIDEKRETIRLLRKWLREQQED
ncbi:MAG: hypothetical protein PHV32_16895 [Eubacteriales bacterium]|nr:hypothetical protein [Eubacteriales bacterium]